MVNKYDVSVIICVKDGQDTITRQLSALAAQQSAPKFEVIVVDNCSTDRTVETVEDWKNHENPVFDLTVVKANLRPSIPYARNKGVSVSLGKILLFCDADDFVSPGWVSAFWRCLKDSPGIAGGWIQAVDSKGKSRPEVFGKGLIATKYLPHVGNCNCAISREVFYEVDGYDESLPKYGFEDVEISWRIQEKGYSIFFEKDAVVIFSLSDSSRSIKKKITLGRGRVLMARRFPLYDSNKYFLYQTLRDLIKDIIDLMLSLVSENSISKKKLGIVVASAGRVLGSIQYSGKNYAPPRKGISQL